MLIFCPICYLVFRFSINEDCILFFSILFYTVVSYGQRSSVTLEIVAAKQSEKSLERGCVMRSFSAGQKLFYVVEQFYIACYIYFLHLIHILVY